MASPVDHQFFDRLSNAHARFGAGLPELLGRLAAAGGAFDPRTPDTALMQELQALLHAMAGGAATFGFRVLGHQARTLEQRLRVLMAFEACVADEWHRWFGELERLIAWSRRDPRAAYYSSVRQ
jgi:HPt (histidine-containing phosphotransfer) domain-containing protein